MILKSKICGVTDAKILRFLVDHKHPPQLIGFIVNYPKDMLIKKLKELLN